MALGRSTIIMIVVGVAILLGVIGAVVGIVLKDKAEKDKKAAEFEYEQDPPSVNSLKCTHKYFSSGNRCYCTNGKGVNIAMVNGSKCNNWAFTSATSDAECKQKCDASGHCFKDTLPTYMADYHS